MKHTKHDVGKDLVIVHLDVANGDTQAEDLLQLELDGRADLSELVLEILCVRDRGRELASCRSACERGCSTEARVRMGAYPSRDRDQGDGESA